MRFADNAFKLYDVFVNEKTTAKVPEEYVDIVQQVIRKVHWNTTIEADTEAVVETKRYKPDDNKVMVALSGGLDSVYLLFKLLDKGYTVTAVHIAGLNKSTANMESEAARKVAKIAGVEFINVQFKAPKQAFPDNPFKNQLALGIMLDIGLARGIVKYALGSDWTTPLHEAVTGYTITDSIEVNRAYWEGVKKYVPEAELIFIDNNEKKYQRLQYLYSNHLSALNMVSSCICPTRFRDFRHKQNIQKYNVSLMHGRCGSCYKCSMEYLLLVEAGLIKRNKDFADHCWNILATSQTSHRPDLFSNKLSQETRMRNLLQYGS